MTDLLKELLEALETVGRTNEELYDTAVREQLFDAIYYGFVEPDAGYVLPRSFGLYTPEANATVRTALERYTGRALVLATELGIEARRDRLAVFQNSEVCTTHERQYTDDFFGWMDPAHLSDP